MTQTAEAPATVVQGIDPKILAIAAKLKEKQAKKEEGIREKTAKHKHAIIETLAFDEKARKWECAIRCTDCGNEERHVYTSDLFQISRCDKCSETASKAKRAAKKAELKAALELIRAKKA